jgi:probable HAF family extracellular repeat protein
MVGYAGFYPDARPALWQNGTLTDLGTLGGAFGQATDVNNLGQVVGGTAVSNEDGPPIRAFLWQNGDDRSWDPRRPLELGAGYQ